MIKNIRLSKLCYCYFMFPVTLFLSPYAEAAIEHHYYIQMGTFRSQESAENLLHFLGKQKVSVRLLPVLVKGKTSYEVQVGPYLNKLLANHKRKQLGSGFVRSYQMPSIDSDRVELPRPVFHQTGIGFKSLRHRPQGS